jgi:hypothetical protein
MAKKIFWDKAEVGAEASIFVFADTDGKRFSYEGKVGPMGKVLAEADRERSMNMYLGWYLEHLDQAKTNRQTQGKQWEYPPYCVNGAYISKEKFIEIEKAGWSQYRAHKIAYQETKKFPDLGR